jgi:3-oxo-5-alpha-steroid 4-dehydrogenase 1
MSYGLAGVSAMVAVTLTFTRAAYGRYYSTSFGPLVNRRLTLFALSPSLFIPLIQLYLDGTGTTPMTNRVLLAPFIIHYIHRSSIDPLLSKHGSGIPMFFFGIVLTIASCDGYLHTRYLLRYAEYPANWLTTPTYLIGITLCISGMAINIHSDSILRSLKSKQGEYKIPRGGLFEYVSGANFFGEIVEWTGYAITCWSLPTTTIVIISLCNIAFRAVHHHRWYKEKFDDYPTNRKALIPFIL